MRSVIGGQRGLTLLEMLVVLPIAALLGLAATGVITQIIQSSHNSERMAALRQVQSAGYWLSQDCIQAQEISLCAHPGFPLTISWTDWEDNQVHQVEYSLQPLGSSGLCYLQRSETIDGQSGDATVTVVAQDLDPSGTYCSPAGRQLEAGELLVLTLTARVGQKMETRTYEIRPRALL